MDAEVAFIHTTERGMAEGAALGEGVGGGGGGGGVGEGDGGGGTAALTLDQDQAAELGAKITSKSYVDDVTGLPDTQV